MRTVPADDVFSILGNNRDILLLALAVLVLVEGAIIVLWARRAIHLQREVARISVEAANAMRTVTETAAAAAAAAPASGVTMRNGERKVYSVAGRTTPLMGNSLTPPAAEPSAQVVTPAAWQPSPPASAAPAPAPAPVQPAAPAPAAPAPTSSVPTSVPPAAPATPAVELPAAEPEPHPPVAEPPADYVNPVVEKAAAWVLPEVEASRAPAQPEPPAAPEPSNGWFPAGAAAPQADPVPTTMGWSGTTVPVEPAADFAVITDPESIPAAPPARPAAAEAPRSFTVLDGASNWSVAPTPFDGSDDPVIDDRTGTGDILLVEDDPTIAKLYSVLLQSRGYSVRHAVDGLDGLDYANQKRPDLVLLDIMMPRMNGIAFLQALRAGDMRDVPVVVLSNFMEKQLVDDAMSLGALEYMVKAQTRPEALVGALPHWLKGERAFTY